MSTILIADDAEETQEFIGATLEVAGFQLIHASNGTEALEQTLRFEPDLILLDVMMPGMDGYEVCRRIRANPKIAAIPILILTALDNRKALMQGIEAGADDFLSKPVNRKELLARVKTITRLNRYRIIAEQRAKLEEMTARLITAQEQERLRTSRELHDDVAQTLTTLLFDLRNLQAELTIPAEQLSARLDHLHNQVYEVSVKIRNLAHDLRPPVLDMLGLIPSLQAYCNRFSSRTNIPVLFEPEDTIPELSDAYNVTLYRILQEALNNVAKHALASQVWVGLNEEDDWVHLVIQDNGVGLRAEQSLEGIGIIGMRERLAFIGGTLHIHAPQWGGVILTASLPVLISHGIERAKEVGTYD